MQKIYDILSRFFYTIFRLRGFGAPINPDILCLDYLNLKINKMPNTRPLNPVHALGILQEDLDSCSDIFTGQSPVEYCSTDDSNRDKSLQTLMGELKNYWLQLPDPLDSKILDVMSKICEESNDTRKDLLQKYTVMVGVASNDSSILIDDLIHHCKSGPGMILAMIKIAITAYTAAKSREALIAIEQITTTATDLAALAEQQLTQQKYTEESMRDHILSWNSMNQSISKFMGEIDQKTLQLTQPGRSYQTRETASPSLSSKHSPNVRIDGLLELISGANYRCQHGTLKFLDDANLSFMADSEGGTYLAKLISVVKSTKPIKSILNRDLNSVIEFLKSNPDYPNYNNWDHGKKWDFLKKLVEHHPPKPNQWTRSFV